MEVLTITNGIFGIYVFMVAVLIGVSIFNFFLRKPLYRITKITYENIR